MKLKGIKLFSQNDNRWRLVKLGTSTVHTIGSSGCLVCCVTTVVNYHGEETTPDRLNDDLKRVEGFYQACLLVYGKITEIYKDIVFDWDVWERGECSSRPAPIELIKEILDSKRIPIVKVDFKPETAKIDEHWVCVIGIDDAGSLIIADPIDGTEQYFQNRYGDPKRYIFRIIAYNGPIKEEDDDEDKIKDLEAKVKSQAEQILEQSAVLGQLEGEITRYEKELVAEKKLKNEARDERNKAISRAEIAENKVKTLEDGNRVLVEKNKVLKVTLKASVEAKIRSLSLWELIKLKYFTKGVKNNGKLS